MRDPQTIQGQIKIIRNRTKMTVPKEGTEHRPTCCTKLMCMMTRRQKRAPAAARQAYSSISRTLGPRSWESEPETRACTRRKVCSGSIPTIQSSSKSPQDSRICPRRRAREGSKKERKEERDALRRLNLEEARREPEKVPRKWLLYILYMT